MSLDILAWHYSASELLWGSPKFRVLEAVVSRGAALHVDSTVLVPLQRMLEKARMWQMAAKNAISRPPPEEFDMQVIKELRNQKEHIPVKISQERRLAAMIEDEGARYCICKGPSDGSFMIGCDHCDEWYHGRCVGVSTAVGDALAANAQQYMCPMCSEKNGTEYKYQIGPASTIDAQTDDEEDDGDDEDLRDDNIMKNEWLATLWPPCRLLVAGSKTKAASYPEQAQAKKVKPNNRPNEKNPSSADKAGEMVISTSTEGVQAPVAEMGLSSATPVTATTPQAMQEG
jgi:hypothetical protein